MISSIVLMASNPVLRVLKISEFCTPRCCIRTSLILWRIFVVNAAKINNGQNLWKFPKNGKIRLQVSDVMGLCTSSAWTIMVSSIVLGWFPAFLRFLKFCEFCTLEHCDQTSLSLWRIFVGNTAKIKNSPKFWKLPKNEKKCYNLVVLWVLHGLMYGQ